MVTKSQAKGAAVDWAEVERMTEVPRTYFVWDGKGKEFFKMYKPSEADRIFKKNGWKGWIASTLKRIR